MPTLRDEIIIFNTAQPLRKYMKRRPTHYAEILSHDNRVINLSWAPISKRQDLQKKHPWEEQIFRRLPCTRLKAVRRLNDWAYQSFTKRLSRNLPAKPVIWNFFSGNYLAMTSLPNKISILEICDDTPQFFVDNPQKYRKVKKKEDELTRRADVVFTVSEHLQRKKQEIRSDIYLIRNGVTYDDFSLVPGLSRNYDDELYNIRPPVVGYAGAISKWFDFDLVSRLANRLDKVNFIFVGRISPPQQSVTEKLNRKPNIHFLGERQYGELRNYFKYFDLAHIPFLMTDLVRSVNPIKLYEYLAAGLRVVSTPLPEVLIYQEKGLVEAPLGVEAYVDAVTRMLEKDKCCRTRDCQSIAKQNSWKSRVELACQIIQTKIHNQ